MSVSSDVTSPHRGQIVHLIAPDAIDDPLRPSGGNRYNRKVCDGLRAAGWDVHEHLIPDAWPSLGPVGTAAVAQRVAEMPDHAVVVVDGLIAEASARVLVRAARRLSLAVLVHAVPAALSGVGAALAAARTVIATSEWVRAGLVGTYATAAGGGRRGCARRRATSARERHAERRRAAVRRRGRQAQGPGRAARRA